ncbi:MAG: hypothetical protein M0P71_00880 [Melioribacteraceae bacterium]|nr:hypothetical protein [Melioribacteraceae bacterium]
MCSESYDLGEPNGECPECGEPTVDGKAASGCECSPETCPTCHATPCDESC